MRARRPGRLGVPDRRAALAAPGEADGFVSRLEHAGGRQLHLRRRLGDPAATPWVMLHGLAVSHRYLMPTARRLGPGSVSVPDLAGFGLSGKPATVLNVGEHAEAVAGLMDTLGIDRAAVLGNSFGCQVAAELAVRRPDLVGALILVGPTTDPAAATVWGQTRRLLRDLIHEDVRQAPILARDIREAGARRILTTLGYAVADDIYGKLPAIQAPALLLRGSRDPIAPQSWLERMAERLARVSVVTIDGAAHNVVTTAGAETAAAVRGFVESHGGGATSAPKPPA
ncbi:alpha/beta fold hydrolase [Paractinoplanes hotanensis]|uniref:Alpha/beta hydrolase n=1 Tax=Paractinoplanes hotanensis TaxID=2906497 RepID=A0ABT0Y4N8_9ACTN|nr:alpha/beta hydrolase [Actinoplanes hotanensis]MCM4081006.1 alpha/beta hydrolase [Actinoplanes hotanensis]